ncbi:hypothetical protein CF336_g169 [Tilletia laevis]|nr:hypothetical protein CF336_g169 [Tilletia laevis]KAE8203674.1 hypothetical protein CF328_g1524 [Tilletia controversa]
MTPSTWLDEESPSNRNADAVMLACCSSLRFAMKHPTPHPTLRHCSVIMAPPGLGGPLYQSIMRLVYPQHLLHFEKPLLAQRSTRAFA